MQRINPTDAVRIGALAHWVKVLVPTQTLDPATGGLLPGDPVVVLWMKAGIEPRANRPIWESLGGGGAIQNDVDHIVSCWYREELGVSMFVDYWDMRRKFWRRLEVLNVRNPQEGYRYQELLCKERVS